MEENLKQIILDNSNLVYSVIHKLRGKDYEDLFQVGCLGLLKAYHRFSFDYQTKFTSFAYPYVLGEVHNYMINNRNIHLSPVNMKLLSSIRRAEDVLTSHFERKPTEEEIAHFLEIDLGKLAVLRSLATTESLDALIDCNCHYSQSTETSKDLLMDLSKALKTLTGEEKALIKKRYFDNLTQREVARLSHTNQVRVSRDEQKILNKLRKVMN